MILTAPRGHRTRPATARVREWIFDVLGSPVAMHVLDLFAGVGAVGLEALSRGADSVLFVENWKPALLYLQNNIEKTRYGNRAEIMSMDAARAALRLRKDGRRFELCFCDPPYDYDDLEKLLEDSVLELITAGGTLVVEHRGDSPLMPRGLLPNREESFGETILSMWVGPEAE